MSATRVLIFTCLLVLGGIIHPFSAFGVYLNDFLISSDDQKNYDDYPYVVADREGNFTVIWVNYCCDPNGTYNCGRAYIKKYDSNGNPLTASISVTPESMLVLGTPYIAMHPSGSFVLAWGDQTRAFDPNNAIHTYAQRFDSTANPIGGLIRVDENTPDSLTFVEDIGVDTNGNFVIVWQNVGNETFVRRFLNDGTPAGPIFSPKFCPTLTCSQSWFPRLDVLPGGDFFIIWYELVLEYNSYVPMGRLYDSGGQALWSESMVLTCDDSVYVPRCGGTKGNCLAGNASDAAFHPSGNFMIFTGACDGEPDNNNVYGRLLDSSGQGLTHNFKVNTTNPQTFDLYPKARSDANGGFFALWSECRYSYNEGPRDIFVQRYDSLGNPIGANWRVNTPKSSAGYAYLSFDIASSKDKAFIVWRDYRDWKTFPDPYDTILTNVYGQLVDLSSVGFYMAGDANFDGSLNLQDLIWLVNYVFKGGAPPDPELWIGDVNADCKINLGDVIYFVNLLFKGGAPPKPGCSK